MLANGAELEKLSNQLTNNINTFVSDANSAIKAFVNKVNDIWCSPESVKVGGEIRKQLDSMDKTIDTKWFGNDKNGINGTIRVNLSNFKEVYGKDFTWKTVSFRSPQVGLVESGLNEQFENGDVGTKPGASVTDLDPFFDDITTAYTNLFHNFCATVGQSKAFDNEQIQALQDGFNRASSSFEKEMKKVSEEMAKLFNIAKKKHDDLATTNASNAKQGI